MKRIFAIVLSILCLGLTARAEETVISDHENIVFAKNLSGKAGEIVSLSIEMNNTESVTGFQFDLLLPDGISVVEDADGFYQIELSTDRTSTKKTDYFNSAKQPDGTVRVMCSSTQSYPFSGNSGKVAIIQLKVAEGQEPGNYPIQLKDEVISYANATGCKIDLVESTLTITGNDAPSEDEPSGADTDITGMSNVVYIEAQQIEPGQTVEVPILLKNSLVTTGFTFTLVLPEGLSIVLDEEGYPDVVAVLDRFDAANHASCYGDFNEDGSVEVTCGTTNATRYKLSGNEGAVATIRVKASASMAEGKYPIILKDIAIANEEETTIASVQTTFTYGDSWECSHIHGDVNGDGEVTIEDVNEVIDILLKKKSAGATEPTTPTEPVDPYNGHEYVDLGLPSGLKWATCNVGADNPEDYGDYYAWGETETKSTYNWSTYKWCNGSYDTQTKYCTDSSYGAVDNKTTLDPEDDVAHVKWGGDWRMPTMAEQDELRDTNNCTWTWTTQGGKNGYLVTSKKNGNSIFLPASGYRRDSSLGDAGSLGYYWSSSLYSSDSYFAYGLYFLSGVVDRYCGGRFSGRSVRPVCP